MPIVQRPMARCLRVVRALNGATIVIALLVGCTTGPVTEPPSGLLQHATPPPTARSEEPTSGPVTAGPPTSSPALIAFDVSGPEVIYAGDESEFVVEATTDGFRERLAIAAVDVDFGDGHTTSFVGRCDPGNAPLAASHVFQAAGDFQIAIVSARLCGSATSGGGTAPGVHVLASASDVSRSWPVCSTYQLVMTGANRGTVMNNGGAIVTLHNVSQVACRLEGYPGLALIGATGEMLVTKVEHATTGAYVFPAIPEGRVALSPGEFASFQVSFAGISSGPDAAVPPDFGCRPAARLRVILPGSGEFGTVVMPFAPCDGRVGVTPVFPGRDWISFP